MNYNITLKEVYDILNSSNEIIDRYKKIENQEILDGRWAFHNYEHVKNVTKLAEKILIDLKLDEDTICACKIACLLHDVGALQSKEGHAERSYEYSKKLFEENNWIFKYSNNILNAIRNHSSGFETDDIISLSVIFADKLEIKKTRFTEAGLKIIGNRQYGHIEDITLDINNNFLKISFITDGMIDMDEVNNFYFTAKLFKAVEAFSKKMNLKYEILMDGKVWNLD